MNLINFQERHHMYEDLLATYNQIMQQFPSSFHIYLRKAELLRDLGRHDEAHKLAANRGADFRVRSTDRYRLAEALVGITSEEERWSLS
jgi:hypothetical protein